MNHSTKRYNESLRRAFREPTVYWDGFGFLRDYYGPDGDGPQNPSVLAEDAKIEESHPDSKHFLYWKNVEKRDDNG
jgi:hypothetical protein